MKRSPESSPNTLIPKFIRILFLLWIAALIIFIVFNLTEQGGRGIYGNRFLIGNFFIFMLVSLVFIFALFRKIQQQFIELAQVNSILKEKTGELEQSRRVDQGVIQDVQQAKAQAEERRDSAERLAAIIESSQDAIIGKTLDGILTSWNTGAEKMYGYSSEEVLGKSIKAIIPPEKLAELEKILQTIRKGERLDHFETLRRRKDGKLIDVSLTVSPIKDASGSLIGASAIARDITEIKRAREIALEREKWFGALIEHSSDLLMQLDVEGKVIFVSPSAKRILGYETDEILNRIIFEFIHPDDLNLVHGLFKDILSKEDNAISGEARFRHKDGSWRWLEGSGKNLLYNHNIKAIVINARDFTDRKKFEEKLTEFAAELKKNNEELESFAFIASHDLQEPLRIVSSYAQLFTQRFSDKLDETSSRYLAYIVDNIKRMQDMISGLLIYSRIGRKGQVMSLVDCDKICENALANLKLSIEQKGVNIQKGRLPILLANEVELLQLFQNLIGNAIKYCDKEKAVVEISSYKGENSWVFCVRDNGIGIEQEYFQQIFEIFKRLHTQKEYPGTGIGLAICKKIVDTNGGDIWVESNLGEGSKFFFRMPVRKGNDDEAKNS